MMQMFTPNELGEFELTTEVYESAYAVYVHKINKGKEWTYVGVCRLRDIHKFPDAAMNSTWRERMANVPFSIQVLCVCPNATMAQHERGKVLAQYTPEANRRVIVRNTGQMAITCVQGPNAGKIYTSQTEAAKDNGMTQGTMSNHLNKREGYDVVHGMRFVKGFVKP